MNTRPTDGPADTAMMGVVHSALRRDLVRARIVLKSDPPPDDVRRVALADHLLWVMDFLHHHHAGEDDGLYPLVVSKNPDAAPLVAEMDAEHGLVSPAITALGSSARDYRDDAPGARERVLDALATLSEVLLPHLEREEVEMMPVVSASITAQEWSTWDQATNVKPKGLRQLALEGHWLIDGADAESRERVVSLVPPVPRFVLLRGFAGPYRRRSQRLWGATRAADVPSLTLALAPTWTS
jgi:hemerythrin-like domain-containing protein